jgi:hypothetical protein
MSYPSADSSTFIEIIPYIRVTGDLGYLEKIRKMQKMEKL